MLYQSFLPCPALSEFVRNYTIIRFRFKADQPLPCKLRAPKPEQKIVFYLNDPPAMVNPATAGQRIPPKVSIYSHQCEKVALQLTADFSAFIIFLQPGVLHGLIRLPMMELLNDHCDAELFFQPAEVSAVREGLAAADSLSSMISIVERFLLPRCQQLPRKSSIDQLALRLAADPTAFSLDTAARQACLSTRQFYRRFTERIGISPKFFSRLARFNHAYRYKIAYPATSWSSIAQEFRYTDYHHLDKEFKEFTALTPGEWTKTHLAAPERMLHLR